MHENYTVHTEKYTTLQSKNNNKSSKCRMGNPHPGCKVYFDNRETDLKIIINETLEFTVFVTVLLMMILVGVWNIIYN